MSIHGTRSHTEITRGFCAGKGLRLWEWIFGIKAKFWLKSKWIDKIHRIAADIALNMQPENSWQLGFDDDGDLRWYGTVDGEPVIIDHEPQTSAMSRFKAAAAAMLPLEKYW